MKRKAWSLIYLSILIFTICIQLQGQMGCEDGSKYGHGADSVRCITNLSLYKEYYKNGDYNIAIGYWKVVFNECPKASRNAYIDGAKMYNILLSKCRDANRKKELLDTLMLIYDRRIENYGDAGNVRGRQGTAILTYSMHDDIENLKKAYNYIEESLTIEGVRISDGVLPAFLTASILLFEENEIDSTQLIANYIKLTQIIDKKIETARIKNRLIRIKQIIDDDFISKGPDNCETLIKYFAKEYETKSEDISFLQMLTSLLKERDCNATGLYIKASMSLHKLAPSAKSALNIALLASNNGEFNKAVEYFTEAIKLEDDETTKAKYYYGLAKSHLKLGNKELSNEAAHKAAACNPGFGEPYIFLGQLYAGCKNECSGDIKEGLQNAVYWLAVDMFIKAKEVDPKLDKRANNLISTHKPHYPKKGKAFFIGINEGDTYNIRCWINETTKARFNN